MMERLTQENAAGYLGKTVDSSRRRFHYYPLRVFSRHGVFMVADRNGVAYEIPSEHEVGSSIPFDIVI